MLDDLFMENRKSGQILSPDAVQEIFDKLKEQLMLQEWPNVYFFKFIVPSDSEKLALVTGFFDTNAEITMHPSKTGKYTSISAKTVMMDVDSIIELYERAAAIPGVISL
jgi:hypothetical protein